MAHDIIIRNGTVLDGTGTPGIRADVAIDADRITAIGDLSAACLIFLTASNAKGRGCSYSLRHPINEL